MTSDVMVLVRKARADWLRAQCEVAYVRVLMAAQRCADALRREDKYSPDQPRVPAGKPDGGQWTDGDGGGNQRVAQGTRARGTVSVRIGGLALEATPAQAMRLSNVTSAANAAIARVRERDPNWKPVPHELKTVRYIQSPTSEGVSKSISKTILRGRGQARNVIIDARKQPGMTIAIAERAIGRAFGADVKRGLESVTVLTTAGPVHVLRSIRK